MSSAGTDAPSYDLGVLFVHGIGEHASGSVVEDMGSTFAARLGDRDELGVVAAVRDDDNIVMSHAGAGRWKLAEANWDVSLEEPGLRETLIWLVLVAPWVLNREAIFWNQRRRQDGVVRRALRFSFRGGWSGFGLLLRLMALAFLGPLIQALLVLMALLRWIPAVRRASDLILVRTLGDAYRFVGDPVESSRMASTVSRELEALSAEARNTMIVAHSQGAAVTLEALTSQQAPGNFRRLVTLGGGVGKLVGLQRLSNRLPFLAVWALLRVPLVALLVFGLASSSEASGEFRTGLAMTGLLVLALAPMFGAWSGRRAVARAVGAPDGLGSKWTWVDVWSTRDLVPDGALRTPDKVVGTGVVSVEVKNGSWLHDHVRYLDNSEQVIPLLTASAVQAAQGGVHPLVPLASAMADGVKLRFSQKTTGKALKEVLAAVDLGSIATATAPEALRALDDAAQEAYPVREPSREPPRHRRWLQPFVVVAALNAGFAFTTVVLAVRVAPILLNGRSDATFSVGDETYGQTEALARLVSSWRGGLWFALFVLTLTATLYHQPDVRPKSRSVRVAGAGFLMAAIVGSVWGLAFLFSSVTPVDELRASDCFSYWQVFDDDLETQALPPDAIQVPCDEPHSSVLVDEFDIPPALGLLPAQGQEFCEVVVAEASGLPRVEWPYNLPSLVSICGALESSTTSSQDRTQLVNALDVEYQIFELMGVCDEALSLTGVELALDDGFVIHYSTTEEGDLVGGSVPCVLRSASVPD